MAKISFELPFDNLDRATEFYKIVFGWNSLMIPEIETAVIDTDGKEVDPNKSDGVFSKRSEFAKAPVLIITVDSIDESIEKVKEAGGEILNEKEKVSDFGYSIYAKDSEGSIFCMWEEIK